MTALIKKSSRKELTDSRHRRVRRKISGTVETPRLCIYKSLHQIYAQIIDDEKGVTLVATSTLDKDLAEQKGKTNTEAAKAVGSSIGAKAKEKGITTVVFDRNGFRYHGTVVALADAARENGLVF